ncbi:binuclear zinc transcription factor [Colletotrichum tofieldiae]|nr:binuclear zinc transcription factor [Colletotrichum tofieldiae]
MDTDGGVQTEPSASAGNGSEPLACVTCRSRKLKRKPAFKRKNVKELEERLAQVEDLLKEAGKTNGGASTEGDLDSRVNVGMDDFHVDLETLMAMQNGTFGDKTDLFPAAPGMVPRAWLCWIVGRAHGAWPLRSSAPF